MSVSINFNLSPFQAEMFYNLMPIHSLPTLYIKGAFFLLINTRHITFNDLCNL